MKKILKTIWIPVVLILIIIAIPFIRSNKAMKEYYEGPEALEWLKKNKNPYPFASNHFASPQAAIDFVEKLYSEGAEIVKIPEKCIQTEGEEGGPYADSLIVKLPIDKDKRKNILNLCNNELDPEFQGNLEKDIRDNMIFLWWD